MTRLGQMLYNDGLADGIQKGIADGIQKGIATGIATGIEQGTKRTNQLTARLLRDNRHEDLMRALDDSEFQKQLFEEYQL